MKTQELLNQLNGAIAEAFKDIIGKSRQHFGDGHKVVMNAIKDLDYPIELRYVTWALQPVDIEKSGDIDVFMLDTGGCFEKYKGQRSYNSKGKWLKAPSYVSTVPDQDTVEGIIQAQQLKLYKKDRDWLVEQLKEIEEKKKDYTERLKKVDEIIKILS